MSMLNTVYQTVSVVARLPGRPYDGRRSLDVQWTLRLLAERCANGRADTGFLIKGHEDGQQHFLSCGRARNLGEPWTARFADRRHALTISDGLYRFSRSGRIRPVQRTMLLASARYDIATLRRWSPQRVDEPQQPEALWKTRLRKVRERCQAVRHLSVGRFVFTLAEHVDRRHHLKSPILSSTVTLAAFMPP